jgi:molecular chaperone HtpG
MKESDLNFKRVDSDTANNLIDKDEKVESVLSKDEEEKLKKVFEENINEATITVELKALSPSDLPVTITQSEWMRRMKEMQQMGGGMPMMGNMPDQLNLVVNTNHPLSQKILKLKDPKEKVQQLYDIALLSQNMLKGKKLSAFIERSVSALG